MKKTKKNKIKHDDYTNNEMTWMKTAKILLENYSKHVLIAIFFSI